jgi:hypothetical protein
MLAKAERVLSTSDQLILIFPTYYLTVGQATKCANGILRRLLFEVCLSKRIGQFIGRVGEARAGLGVHYHLQTSKVLYDA